MGSMMVTRFEQLVTITTNVRDIRFDSDEWVVSPELVCVECGQHALIHPDDARYGACRTCFVKIDCLSMQFVAQGGFKTAHNELMLRRKLQQQLQNKSGAVFFSI